MSEPSLLLDIANYLCANGICGGDQSSAPCETARGLASDIVEIVNMHQRAMEKIRGEASA